MAKKKKYLTLYASNLIVKDLYKIDRRIQASGDNISDWYEEMYCDNPGESRDNYRSAIREENELVDKLILKSDRLWKRVKSKYGIDAMNNLDSYLSRGAYGTSHPYLTYKEKRRINLTIGFNNTTKRWL